MNKEIFDKKISELEKDSELALTWNRCNGILTKVIKFEGFNEGKPLFRLKGTNNYSDGNYLSIKAIGDYDSIISIQKIKRITLYMDEYQNINELID